MEKFSYETNGYNRNEVNEFINDVIKETESIVERVKIQQIQIDALQKELDHYKSIENSLNTTIRKAEETGNGIKKIAREESDIIIEDAKHNATRIINEALMKAEKVEQEREILEKNLKIFKRKLRIIMEQQKAVAEELEVLEFDEE